MKLVFCGTPEFAVPSLQALVDAGHEVALVLTQPDRPAGRKMELQIPPVKQVATSLNLPVHQPERLKTNPDLRSTLGTIAPDAIVVVAYGRIIPGWMLQLPRLGSINVHGSLLPRYRGAAPIQWAVANGETETGVTTMLLDSGLDTGDTLLFHSIPLHPDATSAELYPKLSQIGASLLLETLSGIESGDVKPSPQNNAEATLAPILTREDGRIDLAQRTARQTYNRWRGFSPWPGAYAMFRGKRLIIHKMHPLSASLPLKPNHLILNAFELLAGASGNTVLSLDEVQIEGKPRISGAQFARDFQLRPGERLG